MAPTLSVFGLSSAFLPLFYSLDTTEGSFGFGSFASSFFLEISLGVYENLLTGFGAFGGGSGALGGSAECY